MGLMTGKRGLIMGLANDKSIAWGIAEALQAEGAQIGVTYVGDAMKKRVLPLAEQLNATIVAECDAGDPASIAALMKQAKEAWGQIDFIVHAIGFSDKSELRGQYINTSRDNFLMTMDISAYSFTAILQAAQELMAPGASCLTMTYYGAEKVMPNYKASRGQNPQKTPSRREQGDQGRANSEDQSLSQRSSCPGCGRHRRQRR